MTTATEIELERRTTFINEVLSDLIPPRDTWTPVDEALYKPTDLIRVPISHGVVVAREYGIPVVVDLHNATVTFRTGDLVELDANHGVLRRLPEDLEY